MLLGIIVLQGILVSDVSALPPELCWGIFTDTVIPDLASPPFYRRGVLIDKCFGSMGVCGAKHPAAPEPANTTYHLLMPGEGAGYYLGIKER